MKKKRAKILEHVIGEVWSSLQSHLPHCYAKGLQKPDGKKFQKKCVKSYAKLIVQLTKLY